MSRKPQIGACSVCGRAVPRLSSPIANGWVDGHLYIDGRLEKVLCFQHEVEDASNPIHGWDAQSIGCSRHISKTKKMLFN
ncbi:hypothetical protein UFOVP276_213 [uncultured Caudovirales phage]|uniref:Uncharacterized protein n=1 Tax=uncultured Caudovirales phage TaxID=2100421 RepID=A0A6J5LED0_9CAUD|nr:hypothetical protein UFOVP127_107 [uncultured Caudovirales phage]CAB4135257.1 hypothetical protein UFOVP276_213 [uncultured Caudovirales phage]